MAEGRFPGEARLVRYHGRHIPRRDHLPALANWTLDGLQQLLAKRFAGSHTPHRINKVHLVRYADDFIITGTSKVLLAYEVQPLVAQFLQERGLELSHEKTRITHIQDCFDFLGQTLRRYR